MIGNDSDVSEGDVSEPGSVERSPLHSMDISLPATSTESSNLSSSMEDSDLQSLIDVETCRGRVKVRGQRGGSKRGRGRGRKWKRRGGRQGSRGSGGRSGIRGSSGQGSSRPSSYLSAGTIAVLHEIGSVWKKEEPTSYTMPYTRTPGPTSPDVTSRSTPGDLFCHFFSDQVWDLIMVETNRNANSFIDNNSSTRAWTDTTVEELKAFVGLLILMGIVRLPRLELYWSTSFPLIRTPGISSIMPLMRFEQLWRFLHLTDNNNKIPYGQIGHDKLFKVRKLLDLLCPLFESEFEMYQSCAIDEAMIPFKGRLKFKQYMKDKPTK